MIKYKGVKQHMGFSSDYTDMIVRIGGRLHIIRVKKKASRG